MTYSSIAIINEALTLLGQSRLASLEEQSEKADLVTSTYRHCVGVMLRTHPWSFSMRRVVLSPSDATPAFGWAYQYPLPADCVKVDSVFTNDDLLLETYSLEANVLLANELPIKLVYVADVEESRYDALFVEALASFIAYKLSDRFKQSDNNTSLLLQRYGEMLNAARFADSQENFAEVIHAQDVWDARI